MWAFPTRSRLSNCDRFIQGWNNTLASTPVYLRLDEDDPELSDILKLNWPSEFEVVVGPRIKFSQAMQEMFMKYPNRPWYGMLADDLILKTDKWDEKLINRARTNYISYGDEVHEKKIRICHPCINGDLVRLVGFFGLPVVEHFGTDTLWEEIHHRFKFDGLVEDVILEHAHFNFGQSLLDDTYNGSQSIKGKDRAAYREWMSKNFENLVGKISQHFNLP